MSAPLRVFLSHTSELRDFPLTESFVAVAEKAVTDGGDAISNMGHFPATDRLPASMCQRKVLEADVYVGIIGLRYGSPADGQPEKSYTELEFDAAEEAKRPRLIFLLDEDAPLPIPASRLYDDDPELRTRQRTFRSRVRHERVTRTVATPEDLRRELYKALQELKQQPPETLDATRLTTSAMDLASTRVEEVGRKYLSNLYVEREIDKKIGLFLSSADEHLLFIVDRAGNGKTSLVCHIAEGLAGGYIPFLLRPKFSTDLVADFDRDFEAIAGAHFQATSKHERKATMERALVLVDGINEYPHPESALADLVNLLSKLMRYKAKAIVTCRDLFWEALSEEIAERFTKYTFEGSLRHTCGDFTDGGVRLAVSRYFAEFNIAGVLEDEALEQCKFPLLLRFVCEAYAGRTIGPIRDIRLKDLFDEYLKVKTKAISDDLGHSGSSQFRQNNIEAILCDLAMHFKERQQGQMAFEDISKLPGLCPLIVQNPALYNRILDENIVIERAETPSRGVVVSFVYDEFMEYLCARDLLGSHLSGRGTGDRAWLIELLRRNAPTIRYSHIVEYLMSISRDEDHRCPVWNEMFTAGPEWHETIVHALYKIPSEDLTKEELTLLLKISAYEGDDGVTSATARKAAKEALSGKYLYYGRAKRQQIWKAVSSNWGCEEQVKFIEDNISHLDESKWQVLQRVADDPESLCHEELVGFVDRRCRSPEPADEPRIEALVASLKRSEIRKVRRWASGFSM